MTDTAQPGVRGPVHDAKSASTRGPGPSRCAVPGSTAAASTPIAATAPMATGNRQSSAFITRRLVDLRRRRNSLPPPFPNAAASPHASKPGAVGVRDT